MDPDPVSQGLIYRDKLIMPVDTRGGPRVIFFYLCPATRAISHYFDFSSGFLSTTGQVGAAQEPPSELSSPIRGPSHRCTNK